MTGSILNPYVVGRSGLEARLPAQACHALELALGRELAALRTRARGVNPELAYALMAVREAAMSFVPPEEQASVNPKEQAPRSEWLGSAAAAEVVGVSRRAIGQAISRRQLPAIRVGRHWRINRNDLDNYRARRAG